LVLFKGFALAALAINHFLRQSLYRVPHTGNREWWIFKNTRYCARNARNFSWFILFMQGCARIV